MPPGFVDRPRPTRRPLAPRAGNPPWPDRRASGPPVPFIRGFDMTKTDRVRKLLAAGVDSADIARAVGCHPAYVRVVRNSRMKTRSRSEAARANSDRYRAAIEKIPLERRGGSATAAAMYLRGQEPRMADAAAKCGVSVSAVCRYISRYNLREAFRHG